MSANRPAPAGQLVIIEPFVAEGQYVRHVRAIGPNPGYEPTWIFESDEPLGWNPAAVHLPALPGGLTSLLLLKPRGENSWHVDERGSVIVSGCLHFEDPEAGYCGLIAQYIATPGP